MKYLMQRDFLPYYVAIFASLLLSFWLDYRETVINPDAICYLLSAKSISTIGIKGAMQLCNQARWPFYPFLIHAFAQITLFSHLISAYILNALFTLLTVTSFILIVKILGGNRRTLWLAAGVILLAHTFNDVRESIIRDHGFWGFYLLSCWLLLRYVAKPQLSTAVMWSASLIIATLFRIEGAIFLLFLPFVMVFRFRYFIYLHLPLIILCLLGGSWLLLYHHYSIDQLSRVGEMINEFRQGIFLITDRLLSMKTNLAQYVLTSDSYHDASVVLIIMMISWYLVSVMSNLTWIYTILVAYAWYHLSIRSKVLTAYIIINIIITFGFLLQHVFLSNRYLIALSLILMLWVPFALNNLFEQRNRLCAYAAVFFIMIFSLGGIFDFGYSKLYIHQGGDWIAANVPATASLYANDYQLMYYSKHFGNQIFDVLPNYTKLNAVMNSKWKQYDYIALRIGHEKENQWKIVQQEINRVPVAEFQNKRGDRVVVYKLIGEKA